MRPVDLVILLQTHRLYAGLLPLPDILFKDSKRLEIASFVFCKMPAFPFFGIINTASIDSLPGEVYNNGECLEQCRGCKVKYVCIRKGIDNLGGNVLLSLLEEVQYQNTLFYLTVL